MTTLNYHPGKAECTPPKMKRAMSIVCEDIPTERLLDSSFWFMLFKQLVYLSDNNGPKELYENSAALPQQPTVQRECIREPTLFDENDVVGNGNQPVLYNSNLPQGVDDAPDELWGTGGISGGGDGGMGMGQNAMPNMGSNSMSGIGGNMSFNLGSMNSNLPPASSAQVPARPPRPTTSNDSGGALDLSFLGHQVVAVKALAQVTPIVVTRLTCQHSVIHPVKAMPRQMRNKLASSLKGKKKKKKVRTTLKTTHEPNHKKSYSDDPFAMLSNAPDTGMESNGILQMPTSQSSNNGGSTNLADDLLGVFEREDKQNSISAPSYSSQNGANNSTSSNMDMDFFSNTDNVLGGAWISNAKQRWQPYQTVTAINQRQACAAT